MDSSQYRRPITNGECERFTECGDKVDEVTPTKLAFAKRAEMENPGVIANYVALQHVVQHGPTIGGWNGNRHVSEPSFDFGLCETALLQDKRHNLLRINVRGARWRNHRINNALPPEGRQGQADEELLVVCCEQQAISSRRPVFSPSGPCVGEKRRRSEAARPE